MLRQLCILLVSGNIQIGVEVMSWINHVGLDGSTVWCWSFRVVAQECQAHLLTSRLTTLNSTYCEFHNLNSDNINTIGLHVWMTEARSQTWIIDNILQYCEHYNLYMYILFRGSFYSIHISQYMYITIKIITKQFNSCFICAVNSRLRTTYVGDEVPAWCIHSASNFNGVTLKENI